jgi:hypothetical protein
VNAKIKQLIDEDLPLANKAIDEAGVPFLSISGQTGRGAQRRRQQ